MKKGATATPEPVVVIMIGLPGSGKSTWAHSVAKRVKGVEVCARDELGSTEAVKKGIEKSLKHRQSVIVDCVNMHPKDRIMWATYARQQCPTCRLARVFVDTPVEECIERAKARKNHPTLSPENAEEAIAMFGKGFKQPHESELGKMGKFDFAETIADEASAKAVADALVNFFAEKKDKK